MNRAFLVLVGLAVLAAGCARSGEVSEADLVPDEPTATDSGAGGSGIDAGRAPFPPDAGAAHVDAGPPAPGIAVLGDPPPPPIAGGTLLALRGSTRVVAADLDRDVVWVADVGPRELIGSVALGAGAQPWRLAEDDAGRVHVVLRGTGEVVTIDPSVPAEVERRTVCGAPRGIAWDAWRSRLLVACAGGELVVLPASGGAADARFLEVDLRDVVVDEGAVYLSVFRTASTIRLHPADLTVRDRIDSTVEGDAAGDHRIPRVAWRMIGAPGGGVVLLAQNVVSSDTVIDVATSGYGVEIAPCGSTSISESALVRRWTFGVKTTLPQATLTVDLAWSPDGTSLLLAVPGNVNELLRSTMFEVEYDALSQCATPHIVGVAGRREQIVAVASAGPHVVGQSRQPAGLLVNGDFMALPGVAVFDTGHHLFHGGTRNAIACASCHPEGGDDGHSWSFSDTFGRRRTQTLLGGIGATIPFHWAGEMADMRQIMDVGFRVRMRGPHLEDAQVAAIERWVDSLPLPVRPAGDAGAIARGAEVFDRAGCPMCHTAPLYTNNETMSVDSRGGPTHFQVPSLRGVAYRAPYLHDGCAPTLEGVLDGCASGGTGFVTRHRFAEVAALDAGARRDLLAFVSSL